MKKFIILIFLFLTSCATYEWKTIYLLYGAKEQAHDKNLHYGDFKLTKLGEYQTEQECNENKNKGADYDEVLCLKAYR